MPEQKTNVFISFSYDASANKKETLEKKLSESNYAINYSEKVDRSEMSDDTIWKELKGRIAGSSVMIVIYSEDFERNKGGKCLKLKDNWNYNETPFHRQGWIYKEIRCGLRSQKHNDINGIIVVMPDEIYSKKFTSGYCQNTNTNTINLNKANFPEILLNNYINKRKGLWTPECGCCLSILQDSYIPIIKESTFMSDPKYYIETVKEKRDHVSDYEIKKETD